MIGKRLLQLIVHATTILALVFSIPGFFRHHVDVSAVIMAVGAIASLVPLAVSVKLNWILLKKCKLLAKLPETSRSHFAFIALTPLIVYFAGSLRFSYHHHTSSYWLYAEAPDWLWLPGPIIPLELAVVASELGIFMFVFYVFAAMLIFTMHALGLFSEEARNGHEVLSRALLSFQILTGVLLVSFILFLLYHFCLSIFRFIRDLDFDPGLFNTANLGVYFFNAINLILLGLLEHGFWWTQSTFGNGIWRLRETNPLVVNSSSNS